jgi:hypothetical protein
MRRRTRAGLALAGLAGVAALVIHFDETVEYLIKGATRDAREAPEPPPLLDGGGLLVVALDGLDRHTLYDLLRRGRLPNLSRLLGGQEGGRFPHAHFDDRVLSTMPSSTIPAWAAVFTGEPPATNGVTGNECFVREKEWLAALAPVSFSDTDLVMSIYTDDTGGKLLAVPTIYERMRVMTPGARIWVSMSQFYRGADRILSARRAVFADAFIHYVEGATKDGVEVFSELDEEAIEEIQEEISEDGAPDVLTVYLSGADLYTHQSSKGPDEARRLYLEEELDEELEDLVAVLEKVRALDDRYVVLLSDHGHTAVPHDDRHALDEEPRDVLGQAGFRVRKPTYRTDDEFDTVLAYGGATAFVYLADRSRCSPCNWALPPRWEEDVLPAAEALRAGLEGAIDLVLVRRPRPFAEDDAPFDVYLGGGRVVPLAEHLRAAPRERYVALELRLADLAAGPRGERAGDILLVTRSGDEAKREDRFYFSGPYHSWHGSPSRRDSEVPFIVAHRQKSSAELARLVESSWPEGEPPRLQHAGRVILSLWADAVGLRASAP